MVGEIHKLNSDLFSWYSSLPDRNEYTNPYLILPDENYVSAQKRILILGKETNGWGEFENCNSVVSLESLYEDMILKENIWGCGSQFWDFYFEFLRPAVREVNHDIGLCVSNVALMGYKYNCRNNGCGFNVGYSQCLKEFLEQYISILKPNVIICFLGFGTIGRREKVYLNILNLLWGEYDSSKDICYNGEQNNPWPLRKLAFQHADNVYGTRHPQFTNRVWRRSICDAIREYIAIQL